MLHYHILIQRRSERVFYGAISNISICLYVGDNGKVTARVRLGRGFERLDYGKGDIEGRVGL